MTITTRTPVPTDEHEPEATCLDDELDQDEDLPEPSPYELPQQKLEQFLKDHHPQIRQLLVDNFQPTYDPRLDTRPLPALKRRPLGAQDLGLRAAADRLDNEGYACIVGEMGVGKTYIAIAAAAAAKDIRRVVVLVPPHLTTKWKREVQITLPSKQVHAEIVTSITQLERLRKRFGPGGPDQRMLFVIMSHWQAKTSHYWRPAMNHSTSHGLLSMRQENLHTGGPMPVLPVCPDCGAKVTDEDDVARLQAIKPKQKVRCQAVRTNGKGDLVPCNGPLWSADNRNPMIIEDNLSRRRARLTRPNPGKDRRVALADYIGKKMQGFFQLTIADEMHQFKAKGSAQGISAGNLTAATGKSLALTGTLMGGQSTTIFYLLHRFSSHFRRVYGYNDTAQWRNRYGFTETTQTWKDDDDKTSGHGAQSKRKEVNTTVRELPGITPGSLFHVIGHTIFLKLRDVSDDLPLYEELVTILPMSKDAAPGDDFSQSSAYDKLEHELKRELTKMLNSGSKRLLGAYLQSLLAYPDGCVRGETVKDPASERTLVEIPPLSEDVLYPKEQRLLELIRSEKAQGRRVLVYTKHVDRRDITVRLQRIVMQAGHRTLVMRASNPDTEHREAWIARNGPHCDVLITNPSLVETGLDLFDFPTIIWFEPDYSVFTVRQASRRSWRIGQPEPVRVHHLVYEHCMQTQALKHIALKAQTSLAIEGEIPQQGLTEYGSGGNDITMQLAKQLLGQIPDDGMTVQQAIELSRRYEDTSEGFLTDHDYALPRLTVETAPQPAPAAPSFPEPDTSDLEPGQQISMSTFLFPDG